MLELLEYISKIFNPGLSLIEYAITTIKDIVYIVGLTGKYLANIPSYFAWMPSQYLTVFTILFSVVAIYKILGREG